MSMDENFPPILNLSVGGYVYTTTLDTVTRDPNSMLGAMFSGRQRIAKGTRGNYFIDRDGALFRHVLNFLRTSELCLPQSFDEFDQLSAEADFYQVGDLIEALQVFREDRYRNQLLLSGREDLIKEVFKEYIKVSEFVLTLLPARGYVRDYRVPWRPGGAELTEADAFDLLYGHGFNLEGCHGGGSDADEAGTQFQEYIFVRRNKL